MTHMELGLQDLDIVTDERIKDALYMIKAMNDDGRLCWAEYEQLRAALSAPAVPAIEGLEEALATKDYERTDLERGRIELAAIRYDELQKGV